MEPLKWGFFGAGRVTFDFISALNTLPQSSHKPIAIAARDLERAIEFSKETKLSKAFGNYEELASDPEIDVIYIGTTNSEHFHQIKLAISNGKHVLCEKPLCLNSSQTKAVVALAREKKVFLMEGFWTRFFPGFKYFENYIQSGVIGDVKQTISGYGGVVSSDRLRLPELGGGVTLNYGVYGIQHATRMFGRPDEIVAVGHLHETGVDSNVVINLTYKKDRRIATIVTSSISITPPFQAFGSKGVVSLLDRAYAPIKVDTPDGLKLFELPEKNFKHKATPYAMGFIYEAEEVRNCIQNGKLESDRMSLDESIMISEITEEIRKQLGVKYPQDS